MLALDPSRRPSFDQILEHPFLVRHCGRTASGAPAVLVTPPQPAAALPAARLASPAPAPGHVLRSTFEIGAIATATNTVTAMPVEPALQVLQIALLDSLLCIHMRHATRASRLVDSDARLRR